MELRTDFWETGHPELHLGQVVLLHDGDPERTEESRFRVEALYTDDVRNEYAVLADVVDGTVIVTDAKGGLIDDLTAREIYECYALENYAQ